MPDTVCLSDTSCSTYIGREKQGSWADASSSEGGLSLDWGAPACVEHLLEFLCEELGGGLQHRACLLCFDNQLEVKFPAKCVVR